MSATDQHLQTYVYSTSSRFCYYYTREFKYNPQNPYGRPQGIDNVYSIYVEWCATIGVRADDKGHFTLVVRYYDSGKWQADADEIFRLTREGRCNPRAGTRSGKRLLNQILGVPPIEPKPRKPKAA